MLVSIYIPSRHTLLLHEARWDNGPSQCRGGGAQGEGAREHWPSWTLWFYRVWKQPWSSFSFLLFHLHKKEERMHLRDTVIGNQIVKENQLKRMHEWDGTGNYRSCFDHVTNVFSKGTQFSANIRLQIHLDSVSTCPWKNIHVF